MLWVKNIIEIGFSFGLFVNAVLFIPQIIQLIRVKDAKGLSLLTFGGFCVIQLFVVLHGILKGDYLLTIGYLVSLLTCGLLTALIIFYKIKNNN